MKMHCGTGVGVGVGGNRGPLWQALWGALMGAERHHSLLPGPQGRRKGTLVDGKTHCLLEPQEKLGHGGRRRLPPISQVRKPERWSHWPKVAQQRGSRASWKQVRLIPQSKLFLLGAAGNGAGEETESCPLQGTRSHMGSQPHWGFCFQ